MTVRISRDVYGMMLAEAASLRSEDLHYKVGVALMRADGTIAALGYNGAPSGVELDWTDRDARRRLVIHGEQNAFRFVRPGEVDTVYSTLLPCAPCMRLMAGYGIRRVVYRDVTDPAVYDAGETLYVATVTGIEVANCIPPGEPVTQIPLESAKPRGLCRHLSHPPDRCPGRFI